MLELEDTEEKIREQNCLNVGNSKKEHVFTMEWLSTGRCGPERLQNTYIWRHVYEKGDVLCKGWTRWPLEVSSILSFDSKILLHRHKTCGENTLVDNVFPKSEILYIEGQF